MAMVGSLFPGLGKFPDSDIPTWHSLEEPWQVFSHEKGSLMEQIEERAGKGGVFIHPTAKVGDFVTIEGPCYIGQDAEIRNGALLRKGSWICEGALVGHCTEIKNSVLLPNSKAPHFNYVGDSILGCRVNLGAGAKLSNVRNDRRSILIHLEDGGIIDSGMVKIGAIIGDSSQLGCNVVTNPGSVISPGSMIPPNETVSGFYRAN